MIIIIERALTLSVLGQSSSAIGVYVFRFSVVERARRRLDVFLSIQKLSLISIVKNFCLSFVFQYRKSSKNNFASTCDTRNRRRSHWCVSRRRNIRTVSETSRAIVYRSNNFLMVLLSLFYDSCLRSTLVRLDSALRPRRVLLFSWPMCECVFADLVNETWRPAEAD